MIYKSRKFNLGEHEVVLRSATLNDSEMLQKYISTVCGETRFLLCESDEIGITKEEEFEFIKRHNESPDEMLIIGFIDGEHVGNCSFEKVSGSRRYKHRVGIGIALYQRFTSLGLGRLMLTALLEEIKSQGYEQVELAVKANNTRAIHLYESLGFVEYGRLPNADKYDDGTYDADILMVKTMD